MMKNETILIVDDHAKNVQLIGKFLKTEGYNFLIALDGENALKTVSKNDVDMILLDISMPEMDGYEVCAELKKNESTKDIPVIFMTARVQIEDIVKGFETGAVDYITKPFNSKELLQRIETHIKIRNQQKELEEKNEKLKELNATKKKFFSIVSHDLRGPFGTMVTMLEDMLNGYHSMNEEEKEELLREYLKSSKNTFNLVQNLLSWSSAQLEALKLQSINLPLKEVIEKILRQVQSTAESKEISIELEVPEDIQVYVDYNSLALVIRNLVTNGIKFTSRNGKITITAEVLVDTEKVEVCVADNGMGMKPEIVEKLFRIDESVKRAGTEKEIGTGLGLILCSEHIQRNGGSIRVESEPENGSRFYFTLPISI